MIRIEVRLLEDISLGWGLVARMNKGAAGEVQRRKVNNEIWLPASLHFRGSARLFLLKGMAVDTTSEYSGFMKFTVETQVKFQNKK